MFTPTEKELMDVLQQSREWHRAHSEAGAEEVARTLKMNPEQTRALVAAWIAENPIINRIDATLDRARNAGTPRKPNPGAETD